MFAATLSWTETENPAGDIDAELAELFALSEIEAKTITPASISSCTSVLCHTFVIEPAQD